MTPHRDACTRDSWRYSGEGDLRVDVPAGTSGRWSIDKVTPSDRDIAMCGMRPRRMGGQTLRAEQYTRLLHGGSIVMSDTPDEQRDHRYAISQARGVVLLNGLGLGMMLNACALRREVKHVICVEIESDVIQLVAAHWLARHGSKVEIIHADAMTWQPPKGARFGMVWHDIWPDICSDNLPAMHTLHRRYARRCDWQGSWSRAMCEMAR